MNVKAIGVLATACVIFWGCATAQKPSPPPVAQLKALVESEPGDADVFLSGRPLGKTPLTLQLKSVDEAMQVQALREGAEPVEKRIRWVANDELVIRFRFGEPTPLMKRLNVAKVLVFDFAAKTTFDVDRSEIKPEFEPLLTQVAELVKKYFASLTFYVCGHTDSSGGYQHNLELSLARATAVRDFLVQQGIGAAQMTIFGFGPDFPEADNASPEGRALNRRTELVLPQS